MDRAVFVDAATRRSTTCRFLLTFRPFSELPEAIQFEYLSGRLHLLPCPHSLLFWGAPYFQRLAEQLPDATANLALAIIAADRGRALHADSAIGLDARAASGSSCRPTILPCPCTTPIAARIGGPASTARTTNWRSRPKKTSSAHVMFSTAGDDIELYGKPMARNIQLWDHHFQLFLDGPRATPDQLAAAAKRVRDGGLFGYRFQFPPMRVGRHEVFWHRPLVAYRPIGSADVRVLDDAPLGVMVARPASSERKPTAEIRTLAAAQSARAAIASAQPVSHGSRSASICD